MLIADLRVSTPFFAAGPAGLQLCGRLQWTDVVEGRGIRLTLSLSAANNWSAAMRRSSMPRRRRVNVARYWMMYSSTGTDSSRGYRVKLLS